MRPKALKWYSIPIVLLLVGTIFLSFAPAQGVPGKPFLAGKSTEAIESVIAKMSTLPMLGLAKAHGLDTIIGKKIVPASPPDFFEPESPGQTTNVSVANSGYQENEPSIAAKPNANIVVAASHRYNSDGIPDPCVTFRSTDGEGTWSGPISLPLLFSGDDCSDPVVRYAPNGGKVYAAYMSIRGDDSSADIVVSTSTDDGQSWSGPVVAIAGSPTIFPDKPWLDVHTFWAGTDTNNNVYVTTTRFYSNNDCDIAFVRSTNGGSTFSGVTVLASSTGCNPTIQGSRPIGGPSGSVLVCWYNSETDGWLSGVFDIRCKSSNDYGSSFGSEIIAVNNQSYELPKWLCPNGKFHRWWGGMFPSLIIAPDGVAHMVFTADPTSGARDGECGDIYYANASPSYGTWSSPTRLNNDNTKTAQGYPTITAKQVDGSSQLVVSWEDHRLSPNVRCSVYGTVKVNCIYDEYYRKYTGSWGANTRLTGQSSLSDYLFIGDYIDSSTNQSNVNLAHVIWTDRRTKTSVFNYEDDIYADVVPK